MQQPSTSTVDSLATRLLSDLDRLRSLTSTSQFESNPQILENIQQITTNLKEIPPTKTKTSEWIQDLKQHRGYYLIELLKISEKIISNSIINVPEEHIEEHIEEIEIKPVEFELIDDGKQRGKSNLNVKPTRINKSIEQVKSSRKESTKVESKVVYYDHDPPSEDESDEFSDSDDDFGSSRKKRE